ncbi:MAG: efflux RND transporter permease subunit [Bacteroidota bacterium]
MKLTNLAVKRPITTLMVFSAVLILGLASLQRLPMDLFPEIEPPVISVFTIYPGASAEEVEKNVSKILEDALTTVTELKKITSTSVDGMSTITLEFNFETNLDEASNDIRDAIDRNKRFLPEDAEAPNIFKFNTSLFPILVMAATADESYPALNEILEKKLVAPLNRLPGVGAVLMFGGPVRQIKVNIDPARLEAYNLTVQHIARAIQAENLNLPAGNIKMGKMDYNLRIEGEIKDPAIFKTIVVGQYQGRIVYLEDVAEVIDGLKERTITESINGKPGLRMIIQKQSDANTMNVAKAINKKLPELIKKLPSDIKIHTIIDTSEFIGLSISNLGQVLIFGGVFVILVVLFFLRQWRSTFIIFLTIPFSLIVAMIYLYVSGNSLNMISISSLAIAMGMVVDDAIVVLENISTHIDKGRRPKEAAIYGTNEVGLAVVATTLTVVAVFLPLAFLTGIAGVMFKQLGYIVTITVVTSTLAALTLTPMLSSKLLHMKKKIEGKRSSLLKVDNYFEGIFKSIGSFYSSFLTWALNHKKTTIIMVILIFAASLILLPEIGTEFLPQSDEARLMIEIELETGRKMEESVKIAERIETIITGNYSTEVKVVSASSGIQDAGINFGGSKQGSHVINFMIRLTNKSERDESVFQIAEELRDDIAKIPGIINFSVNTGSHGMFGGGGSPLEIQVIGHNFEQTTAIADTILNKLKRIPGARDVLSSRGSNRPELKLILNREKMAKLGLNTAMVADAIRNRIAGKVASKFREEGNEYDIFIRYMPEYRTTITSVEDIPLTALTGKTVKVKDIGKIEEQYAPIAIDRKDRERVITVSSSVSGRSLGEVTSDIKKEIAGMKIPTDVDIEYGGQVESQQETFNDLILFLALSIMLVFIVMASQFESLVDPFIIMFSIPFAFSGVLIGLFLGNVTLNVVSFLGAVILVGIVVKNAILLVDYINLMCERGLPLTEAIVTSGVSRLRPVLMTTLTTILAMSPLVLSVGEGSETWKPMGVSVIGGLTFSTIITLIIVPVMYAIFKSKLSKKAIRARIKQKR